MALQSQDFQVTSPASGSPLPISGTDPIPHGIHAAATVAGGPNTVLRVIVESLLYPVSLDILHQIFQRFGKVLKIVTFNKNNSFQVSSNTIQPALLNTNSFIIFSHIFVFAGAYSVSGRTNCSTRKGRPRRSKYLQWLLYIANWQQQINSLKC